MIDRLIGRIVDWSMVQTTRVVEAQALASLEELLDLLPPPQATPGPAHPLPAAWARHSSTAAPAGKGNGTECGRSLPRGAQIAAAEVAAAAETARDATSARSVVGIVTQVRLQIQCAACFWEVPRCK